MKFKDVTEEVDVEFANRVLAVFEKEIGKDTPFFLLVGFNDGRVTGLGPNIQSTGVRAVSNMSAQERGIAIAAALRNDPDAYSEYMRVAIAEVLSTPQGKAMMDEFMKDMLDEFAGGKDRAN